MMLQAYYNGSEDVLYREVPDPVTLVDQIKYDLANGGGVYHHFGPSGNDWDVASYGNAKPMVFNWRGTAPADVLAAFPSASAQQQANAMDPHGPGNGAGGSDLANILAGVSFVSGGAVLSGGTGFFSTVFNGISDAVSSVFSAAPGADNAAQLLGAGEAQTFAPGAFSSGLEAGASTFTPPAMPAASDVAQVFTVSGGADSAAQLLGAGEAQTFAPGAFSSGLEAGASTFTPPAMPVNSLSTVSAKDIAQIGASAAAIAKAATSVAGAAAVTSHPLAAFSSPFVLGTSQDALPGVTMAAAGPAAAEPMPYAAFAVAGVVLLGIYFFVLRKH